MITTINNNGNNNVFSDVTSTLAALTAHFPKRTIVRILTTVDMLSYWSETFQTNFYTETFRFLSKYNPYFR